jgi:hypothetical protein
LRTAQIAALGTRQVQALEVADLAVLTGAQAAAFSSTQIAAMSPAQLAAMQLSQGGNAGMRSFVADGHSSLSMRTGGLTMAINSFNQELADAGRAPATALTGRVAELVQAIGLYDGGRGTPDVSASPAHKLTQSLLQAPAGILAMPDK